MKRRISLLVACGALSLFSGSLLARSHDHDHQDRKHSSSQHGDRHGDSRREHDRGDDRDRDHREWRGDRHYSGMHDRGRHEGWYRTGGRVPSEYWGREYVVTDWHRAHLREPRRGYHWVRSDDGDFLMVAVATGIIVEILSH
jgi:Ni/Co efflux regulator RcnB